MVYPHLNKYSQMAPLATEATVSMAYVIAEPISVGRACGGPARPMAKATWQAISHQHRHGLSPNREPSIDKPSLLLCADSSVFYSFFHHMWDSLGTLCPPRL